MTIIALLSTILATVTIIDLYTRPELRCLHMPTRALGLY
jgi:hypothetical protein